MESVGALVEHLFRHESGRIIAALTRAMGARHMDLAEEATQEAMMKALQTWPFRGVPPQPGAWLQIVARNHALDRLRRDADWAGREAEVRRMLEDTATGASETMDDTLAMMLLCCHPAIPSDGRLALTLKTISGFSTREIAAAFLTSEETIAQRIVRAKRRIREEALDMSMPESQELVARLESVCQVLYCMFNEGYFSSGGPAALRRDLCDESIRLLDCIFASGHGSPDRHALKALFHLHLARFAARTGPGGELLDSDDMDVSRFDAVQIRLAERSLVAAMEATEMSAWHIEAAIASAHCRTPRDWPYIASLYGMLEKVQPTPVVLLNKAVALFRSDRRAEAFALLERLAREESLRGYSLLAATQARLHEEAGDGARARLYYQRALACAMSVPARQFLERRLQRLD